MPVSTPVPENDPLMIAWNAYKETEEYANTKKRYGKLPQSADGSIWASFMAGFNAGRTPTEPKE